MVHAAISSSLVLGAHVAQHLLVLHRWQAGVGLCPAGGHRSTHSTHSSLCLVWRKVLPAKPAPFTIPCNILAASMAHLQELEGRWDFRNSWQDTYLAAMVPGYKPGSRRQRRVHGLQSDLLYTPWL